jgi:cytochrome o ubiquinol oxidase subunit III
MHDNNIASTEPNFKNKSVLGFWIYLMTDCVLFATLFATYIVLSNNTNGLPPIREITSLNYVLFETLILLTSSYTMGIALLYGYRKNISKTILWLLITFILGLLFLGLEINEFIHLSNEGFSWTASANMSAYFTLLGTHGLHIKAGLLWIAILMYGINKRGLDILSFKRLTVLSLFWHFLDIVWIFIFSIVFLIGVA